MAQYILLGFILLGIGYNLFHFFKNEYHAKIMLHKKIVSLIFLVLIGYMYFKLSDKSTLNLLIGISSWLFFISGFLSEGFSEKGIVVTPNSLFISVFSKWSEIKDLKYIKFKDGKSIVNFKLSNWEIKQVYKHEEIKIIKNILKVK